VIANCPGDGIAEFRSGEQAARVPSAGILLK